ncbi:MULTISPECIES: MFS transporter [Shouchella]|uniref:MFS transporter n=2 Tax=Shouchella TaxID=2893057 RepID=A0ABY7WBJ2_9BACI|nr:MULTISPECIES: MFS transporter [Shouchella]MED4128146.1 MFS transporter [Shouchella miscanthi]WDF04993.1 MFS transporter [Shouchella hunanensis]GAF21157.1 MFS general substrate transporter [Bacillus sp. JCM 19047]
MAQTPLRKNSTFVLLLIAGIFAVVGFSMFLTTTTWYVVTILGSASSLGIVLIAATVPRLLMMTFGGVVADKYKKTTIMFGTNLAQGLLLLTIYVLVDLDQMTFFLLLLTAAVFGTLDAFFGPASSSMIPKIVPKEQLQKANAYFQGVDQVSFIIGPILAGLIMETGTVATSYLVATILVFLSAIVIFPPFIKEAPVENHVKQSPLKDLREGFQYIKSSNFLVVGLAVLITLNFFVFGALHIAIPLLVDLHGGTPINLSYMEVSLGVGMVISTLILSSIPIRRRGFTSLMGLFAAVGTLLLFSMAPNLLTLTIIVFFIGFSMSFVYIPFFTAAQENTDGRLMGRVMSIIFLAMNGFDPIAYGLVSALVAADVRIQLILFGLGIAGLFIACIVKWKAPYYAKS